MGNKTLWIFGDSHCLPYGLTDSKLGWDFRLANKLNATLKNFAEQGSDNLFIFSSILDKIKKIKNKDIVVVGWSHPSRKSFILESTMSASFSKDCMLYNALGKTFFRSNGSKAKDSLHKWFNMEPKPSGIEYFDRWFKDYYNKDEQKINFKSYLCAVDNLLTGKKYVPFYFSQDSVRGVLKVPTHMCQTEFVHKHKVSISDDDAHMNVRGHKIWANKLHGLIRK